MIVPMRKYAFMVYHKEYDQFLLSLRDVGVVHIKEINSIKDCASLQEIQSERTHVLELAKSLKYLDEASKEVVLAPSRNVTKEEGLNLVTLVEELQEKQTQLRIAKQSLLKDISFMELWGDFDYANIHHLKQAGFEINFYSCPTSRYEPKWGDEYNAMLINSFQSVSYFITFTKKGTVIDIDAERPKMPDLSLSMLHANCNQLMQDIEGTDEQLRKIATEDYNTLLAFDMVLQDEFNLVHAVAQTDHQAEDKLMLLEGWTTEDNAAHLEAELSKQSCFFQQLDITEEDNVPIKLKNNSYSRVFEPITQMFSLPNYKEIDPTALLAPFFMLFFGLCFGDGGYGLLLLLVCTFLKKKVSPDIKPFLSLFQYLGGMTIIIGILTGSFFSMSLASVPALESVKGYFLDSDNLMTISIVIGIVHALFGKAVAAYKIKLQKGTKYCIAPLAWIFVLIPMLSVYGLPSLDIHLSANVVNICYGIAAVALALALLYNTPGKNVFLNFGTGLWNAYNTVFGLLGDVLSYIRLFAIGLTGSILGGVFNSLATDLTSEMSIIPRILCMLFILVFGHSINMGLGMISSLVHPVRLIFVEYFKNSEFEGGGKEYIPFKKQINN